MLPGRAGSRFIRTCRNVCKAAWLLLSGLVIIALPVLAVGMHRSHYATTAIAWFVAGVFVLLALPISFFEVLQHLDNYTRPLQQKKIIRILLMVPIYAIDSWLALRFKDIAIYINTVRECYEAYVIYSFFEYLVAYIGDERILVCILAEKPQVKHMWPFTLFLKPWHMGDEFLQGCKAGVHNYVFLRPLTTLIALFCVWGGIYGEGMLVFDRAYLYLAFINNASQIWAIYCLVLFYQAAHEELAPMSPFPKFLCVKAVVFFSWWQSVGIDLLFKFGIITSADAISSDYDRDDVATGIQDFLICIEMFFAALAHAYAFSPQEYMEPGAPRRPFWQSVKDMFDISDIATDMYGRVEDSTKTLRGGMSHLATSIQIVPVAGTSPHMQLPIVENNETRSGPRKPDIPLPDVGENPTLALLAASYEQERS